MFQCVARGLVAVGLGIVVWVVGSTAEAAPIITAHRGATTSTLAEGTLAAYKYAVANGASVLEGDVRWTSDGVMVVAHDEMLTRTMTCAWTVRLHTWGAILKTCRSKTGNQPPLRLIDLVAYARSVGKSLSLEIKPAVITGAQAAQFYAAINGSPVRLTSFRSSLASLNRVKRLDVGRTLDYSMVVSSALPYATVEEVLAVGEQVEVSQYLPAAILAGYRAAGLRLDLWTGRTEADYARMAQYAPDGVIVDDVARYQRWLANR